MLLLCEATIEGDVPPKKNLKRMSVHGGMYKDPRVAEFEEDTYLQLKAAKKLPTKPYEQRLYVEVVFYVRRIKDLDNLEGGLYDALQNAGLIKNDQQIEKHCNERIQVKGKEAIHTDFRLYARDPVK